MRDANLVGDANVNPVSLAADQCFVMEVENWPTHTLLWLILMRIDHRRRWQTASPLAWQEIRLDVTRVHATSGRTVGVLASVGSHSFVI